MTRIVCQFSCGAASAVATKLALAEYSATHDVQIVNAFIKQEHEDNRRFLRECEQWFGRPVMQLRDSRYGADVIRVFEQVGYMKGARGASCTKHLKRQVLACVGDNLIELPPLVRETKSPARICGWIARELLKCES